MFPFSVPLILDPRIGSAGLGIAHQIRDAMVESDGISEKEASERFWLIDRHGLITKALANKGLRKGLDDFVRHDSEWETASSETAKDIMLVDVVKVVKPTVLIGTSTHGGAFTKEVVEEMSAHVERPIIFPLSNPSRLVEVHPKDANEWSRDKALLATGSPFQPVRMTNGKLYEFVPSQLIWSFVSDPPFI